MANFTFDKANKLVIVDIASTEVTCQEIVNKVRDWSDNQDNLEVQTFMFASGKEALDAETDVGITVRFVDWKLQFADRPAPTWVICTVKSGNFIGETASGIAQYPIEPAQYVNSLIAQSSSATIISTGGSALTGEEHDKLMTGLDDTIPNGVWEELTVEHTTSGSFGAALGNLYDAHWNKKVLTRINDNEYTEELYDDAGLVVIRTHTLTKVGDVEIRE